MYTTRFPDVQFARPGLQRVLQIDADKFQTIYDRIYKERQTKFAFERFGGISVFPYAPEVPEGSPVPNAVMRKIGFRDYYVKQYGFAVQITAQGRWTDVYNLFDLQFQKLHLGQSMKRTEEKVHALFMENAFSAASDGSNLTIDGTAPFVHNHPLADGSTYSNRGDGVADLTLSISALETATIRLARQPLYENIPNPASGKYILVIPPELAPLAHRLTQSPYQPATAAGDIRNDVSYVYGRFTVIENPYLADTNNWYLFDADENRREWYCLRRLPLSVKLDEDVRAGTYIAVVREEFNPFVLDWRGSWGTAP